LDEPPPPAGEVGPVGASPEPPAKGESGAFEEFVARRLPLVALVFLAEVVALTVISTSAFFPGESGTYGQQAHNLSDMFSNMTASQQVATIFTQNFTVSMAELIPGIGIAFFGYSIYVTARSLEGIAATQGIPSTLALVTLLLVPSTWAELPAYSIAGVENAFLVYAIYRAAKGAKERLAREVRSLVAAVVLIAVELAVADLLEVGEIQFRDYSLVLWVPFVVIAYLAVRLYRRARLGAATSAGTGLA